MSEEEMIWNGFDSGLFEAVFSQIHKDFKLRSRSYWWNRTWGRGPKPEVKICFYFDDPALLNRCPFVCKIAFNHNPDKPYRYFGVAYGNPRRRLKNFNLAKMKEWALRFDFAGVYSYGVRDADGAWTPGELMEALTEGSEGI